METLNLKNMNQFFIQKYETQYIGKVVSKHGEEDDNKQTICSN